MDYTKYFIITIDTEGDNLWQWHEGNPIYTENSLYLQRFQDLCNRYQFKPVWLTNYEMISDDRYVDFIKRVESTNSGELGMHLHAWNSPPAYDLKVEQNGAPYLIEYPTDIMEAKIAEITSLIENRTGIRPVTHRAGRWAMDQRYFDLLIKYGYRVDCSVTPNINWESSEGRSKGAKGINYSNYPEESYYIKSDCGLILETPVSVKKSHKYYFPQKMTFRKMIGNVIRAIEGQNIWLRPTGQNLAQMIAYSSEVYKSDHDYLMFMIHSSELMPGGSPTFQTGDSIEKLYVDLQILFEHVSKIYKGITLRDYAKIKMSFDR